MSIGLTFAAGTAFAAGAGSTLAAGSILTSAGIIAATIAFATGSALAARTVLTSTGVIATAVAFAARSRAAFATSGAARSRTAFASSMVPVMPAMPFEGRTVLGGQGGEFGCVEHAVAVLVILGEQIGGGVGLVVAFSFGCALRMGGGGQREAAEEDRECFVHVILFGLCCVGV
jgi:hypothetical protein